MHQIVILITNGETKSNFRAQRFEEEKARGGVTRIGSSSHFPCGRSRSRGNRGHVREPEGRAPDPTIRFPCKRGAIDSRVILSLSLSLSLSL